MYMAAVATAKEPNSYNVVADEQWRRAMGTEIEAKKKSKTLTIEEFTTRETCNRMSMGLQDEASY